MALDEAITIADKFNDTIFTNTPEMVQAVNVMVEFCKQRKELITGEEIKDAFLKVSTPTF